MRKRIVAFIGDTLCQLWKWLFVFGYLLIALWCWKNRNSLFSLIPIKANSIPFFALYRAALDILFILITLVLFIGIVHILKTPVFHKTKFKRAFERIGLYNSLREYPFLTSVRKDTRKAHGCIYEIKNVGISPVDFDTKVNQLETALNIKIYEITYGKRTSKTLLYAIHRKYEKPNVIDFDNDMFGKELCSLPNLLCVGKTGSGKSYALLVLLGIYTKHIPSVSISICDYKKSSFAQFEDTPNFYGYENVPYGIRAFYQEFSERLKANDEERNKHIQVLLIDEYGALISAQDKKAADELKTMVANMLFMGRSLGIRVLIGVQRADSEHFKAGARDQFWAVLGISNLSKEQKSMLFSEYKDKMTECNGLGEGYLLINGQDIKKVKITPIKDFEALNNTIRQAMCR